MPAAATEQPIAKAQAQAQAIGHPLAKAPAQATVRALAKVPAVAGRVKGRILMSSALPDGGAFRPPRAAMAHIVRGSVASASMP
ncbi:MAG TPA: hypothetical protein VNA57_13865 [Acidimicrobiales bacterium]|nr:hypothetical protein [Acidimicrobiales bacterium]